MEAIIPIAGSVIGGIFGNDEKSDASNQASAYQQEGARLGIEEQRRQFEEIKKLLQPYMDVGPTALENQKNLLGLNGMDVQSSAIQALERSPLFNSLAAQGENALLQNASATGGLRGGNTQAALAKFRPAMLDQLINQQYSRLGGLTGLGQNTANGVSALSANMSNNITDLLGKVGSYQAGNEMAQGKYAADNVGNIVGGIGNLFGGSKAKPKEPSMFGFDNFDYKWW